MRSLVVISALAAFAATVAHAEEIGTSAQFVGRWYGEGWQPYLQQNAQWIDDFRADGTFTMTVRVSDNCKTVETVTSGGQWAYADRVLTMVTTRATGGVAIVPVTHPYRMTAMSERSLAFVSETTGVAYAIRRVKADFKIPSCLTS